ncbi:MAG: ankyrin repeat domain-containing protein [Aeromicrobium sp.]
MSYRLLLPVAGALLLAACSSGGEPADRPESASALPSTPAASTPAPNPYADRSAEFRDRQLLGAARSGNAAKIALLVDAGADTETRDDHARTPLLIASTFDRVDAARALVAAGADPDALDDRHDTPWLVTGVTGSVEMARVLLAADPDLTIRNRFGGVAHIPASERGHADYVDLVLDETDIAVDHVNDLGWTALLEAVILGRGTEPWQRIVDSLVEHGADVSIADRNGITALQHARRLGFTEIAGTLERAGS